MTPATKRVGWFIAVGCAAAAVHFAMVVLLVSHGGWAPLVANVAAWLVAFCVSFAGHWLLTFSDRSAPLVRSAGRFFLVSLAGFSANETAYAILLALTGLRYDVVLVAVLVAVAFMTYFLSARWAFLRST